jgi:hypothetical protein
VPAVNIGNRQTGRERGRNVIDVPYDREAIVVAVKRHLDNGRFESDPIYGCGDAGIRIARLAAELPLSIEKRLGY